MVAGEGSSGLGDVVWRACLGPTIAPCVALLPHVPTVYSLMSLGAMVNSQTDTDMTGAVTLAYGRIDQPSTVDTQVCPHGNLGRPTGWIT